jgi:hypothetical protein
MRYQLRAKFGELPTNVNAAFKAEEALRQSERVAGAGHTAGQYYSLNAGAALPNGQTPGTAKLVWAAADLTEAGKIDWIIEGATYGSYMALSTAAGTGVTVSATSDIDNDTVPGCVQLYKPEPGAAATKAAGCAPIAATDAQGTALVKSLNNVF